MASRYQKRSRGVAGHKIRRSIHHSLDETEDAGGVLEYPAQNAVDQLDRLNDRSRRIEMIVNAALAS